MEVLQYEVISNHTTILILCVTYSILSLVLGFVIYRLNNDWKMGIFVSTFLVGLMVFAYTVEDKDKYEYQKVKVTDWNIVHNEGWEVIKQEGEIAELKRKLEED